MKMKRNIKLFLKGAFIRRLIKIYEDKMIVYHLFFTDVKTNRLNYAPTLILLICEVSIQYCHHGAR